MRPKLELLSEQQMKTIPADAMETLDTVGMFVECEDALKLCRDAGLRTEGERVFFTEDAIGKAIDTAPSQIDLYDRAGEKVLHLGGDEVHFDPGSAALYILDFHCRRRRSPTHQDVKHLGWVTEACEYVDAQATAIIPGDVPRDLADRYRLYLALSNCTKPVITGTFLTESYEVMYRMLVAVRGGEQALRDKPLAIFDCAPTPPLKWSDLTCQALVDCARRGVPSEMVSMPMAGATAPVTLREVVVQHTAECLSGIVISQLAAPGAPIIYGGSPSALDMRHGTTPMGAMETMMIDVAYAEIGKQFGLPTHAYMGLSDNKAVDWQAGSETSMGAVLAALAGINMISGVGMMDYENCQSLEKLVLDNEACGVVMRLLRGVSDASTEPAPALLGAVVEAGHFLAHPHTKKHFRSELHFPGKVIDRGAHSEWEGRGAPTSFEAAHTEVERIIAAGNPAPLPDDVQAILDGLMRDEARRLGHDGLPLL